MKSLPTHMLFLLFATFFLCLHVSLAKTESKSLTSSRNSVEGRRFLNIGPFRPFMRVLGMMGIPLLPLLFIRQLIGTGAAAATANAQGLGGGAGMGSMGALGVLGPFGAGAGLGGIRPLGAAGGIRPLGGLRPLGTFRPGGGLGGLIANAAANAANSGASAAAGGSALFLKKRSIREKEQEKSSRLATFMGALAKLEKVVDQYDLSVPDCQRLIVCEVHKKSVNPSVGSFTEKLIQAFGVEARLERSRFTSNTKTVLKDFLKAARNGLQQRECSAIYYKCPIAVNRESFTNIHPESSENGPL